MFTDDFDNKCVIALSCSSGCGNKKAKLSTQSIINIKFSEDLSYSILKDNEEGRITKLKFSELLKNGLFEYEEPIHCSNCNKTCLFDQRIFILESPSVIALKINCFTFLKGKSIKLLIDFDLDHDSIDLSSLIISQDEANKKGLNSYDKIDISQNQVQALVSMGFSINRAKHAVQRYTSIDESISWLCSVIDNPEYDISPEEDKITKIRNITDKVKDITFDFGISDKYIEEICLKFYQHDVEFIVEYILEHPEPIEDDNDHKSQGNQKYQLVGSIVHLGNSTEVGHYVSYTKSINNQHTWYYNNDDKVYTVDKPSLENSYVLLISKLDK